MTGLGIAIMIIAHVRWVIRIISSISGQLSGLPIRTTNNSGIASIGVTIIII